MDGLPVLRSRLEVNLYMHIPTTMVKMVLGGFLIAAAALKTPTRDGYNAQGVNRKDRFDPRQCGELPLFAVFNYRLTPPKRPFVPTQIYYTCINI